MASYLRCIGHRGAMGHAPENTVPSIYKALELGAQYIEIDVYGVEGQLIVFHDDRLERLTNGTGYVWDHSFEQLRQLTVLGQAQIPTLQEVWTAIEGKACLNIELKGSDTARLVAQFIATIDQPDRVLVSSFNHRQLRELKQLNAAIQIGALLSGLPLKNAQFAEDLGAISVHMAQNLIDREFVEDAHDRGLMVFTYTVNTTTELEKMVALGIDGVFTNYPELVIGPYPQGPYYHQWCTRHNSGRPDG